MQLCKRAVPPTQADFLGKWLLLYFGFANCPTQAPTTLGPLARPVLDFIVQMGCDRRRSLTAGIPPSEKLSRTAFFRHQNHSTKMCCNL